jgi:hypothetical protein
LLIALADQIQKGASNARADDTKSFKSTVLGWIIPKGQSPDEQYLKTNHGFYDQAQEHCYAPQDWTGPTRSKHPIVALLLWQLRNAA